MDKKSGDIYKKFIPCSMVALTCLSSCFGNIPKDTFDLSENRSSYITSRVKYNINLVIYEPTTLKILNSEDIIIRSSPIEMEYLFKSQWSDKLPRMIQSKLIANFENNGKILTIVKPNQGIFPDYQLYSTIKLFEINLHRNHAIIAMSFKLINTHTGAVVAQKIFNVEEPFEKDNKLCFVQSLDRAFNRISSEIIIWTLSSLPNSE
ncbi:MAG: ABC transporter [Candidatus Liberibacter europaeus]|uniref:ABC transporter n=1 Tax=Candidatus Liberibacter europaeus TaxID=744859 RepID=A0A2T4VY79_9HYPH|nr:ABC transporter [Candidatus Liberibacter europaeus]PTL86732.1 MAG: ABC transporter [Candidatus Liberibacter europaeus]